MASSIYDSGWVPVASGAIRAAVDLSEYESVRLIFAASGTNGAASGTASWAAGGDTTVPWTKNSVAYPGLPRVTGVYSGVSNPAANAANVYLFGPGQSGSTVLSTFVPTELQVQLSASASSWARVIVEGR